MSHEQSHLPTKDDLNQSRSRPVDPEVKLGEVEVDPNQSRSVGMFLAKNDFATLDQDNPFMTKMESNPATSAKQARFMRMCAHSPGKAHSKCPSKKVAREFSHQ